MASQNIALFNAGQKGNLSQWTMTKAWLFEALGEELSDEEVRCYAIAFAITSTKLCGDEREAPSPQAARNVMDRAAVVRSETARRRYAEHA